MPNLTTTSSPPVPRSLHDICTAVQRANCGQCWQVPDLPCTTSTITGRDGYHVARFGRAMRRGLISGDDLMIALRAAGVFTSATLIYDVLPGEPMQADTGASEGIAGHLAQLAARVEALEACEDADLAVLEIVYDAGKDAARHELGLPSVHAAGTSGPRHLPTVRGDR